MELSSSLLTESATARNQVLLNWGKEQAQYVLDAALAFPWGEEETAPWKGNVYWTNSDVAAY